MSYQRKRFVVNPTDRQSLLVRAIDVIGIFAPVGGELSVTERTEEEESCYRSALQFAETQFRSGSSSTEAFLVEAEAGYRPAE